MFHYVYEVTNNKNGMKYIGKRSCKCNIENDKYLGSGRHLRNAIKKYGEENFSKKILINCDTEKEAYGWEDFYTTIVTAWDNPLYYNLIRGGKGGNIGTSEITRKRKSEGKKGDKNYNYGKHLSDETKRKIGISMSKCLKGKKATLSARKKMSESRKGRFKGIENGFSKKVRCVTTGKDFDCIKDASVYYKISRPNISNSCNNPQKSCGKIILDDGIIIKLFWEYIRGENNE